MSLVQLSVFVLCVLSLCLSITAHSASEWQDRVIYQVLTDRIGADGSDSWSACSNLKKYCGGTYSGIEAKLDYITGMGFDAIWISPMPLNAGDDYHGYAFLDLYSLNDHFGDEASLKSLIKTAHAKGVWVMLDVVANHVAPVDTSYTQINPFNESYYYHDKCQIEDWNDQDEVENCRLANLPDLDQNNDYVRSTLIDWVSKLKATLMGCVLILSRKFILIFGVNTVLLLVCIVLVKCLMVILIMYRVINNIWTVY